ncbi:MAG: MlaD family protein [Cytophagaceae bacterium]
MVKNFKNLVQTLLVIFLFSCSSGDEIYVKFNHAEGLNVNDPVTLNGWEVGKVTGMALNRENNIIARVKIKQELTIPNDSEFLISNTDLLGSKQLEIHSGASQTFISPGDTVNGKKASSVITDSLIVKIMDKLLFKERDNEKCDSLLIELRRMNENLEKGRSN